jgi:hypothetical protein
MRKAIVFTLYQRPFYTRKVLQSWRAVRGIKDWDFHFYIDPSNQSRDQIARAHDFLMDTGTSGSVTVNEVHMGVLRAPYWALSQTFDSLYEYVVLAEEDVEVGNDVLEYMLAAQEYAHVACAWSDEDAAEDEMQLRKWFTPWCWGTDAETWNTRLKPTWDLDYSSADERGPGGWDCNIGLRLVNDTDLKVMFPRVARARHIGQHLGVHQDPAQFGELEMPPAFWADRKPVEWRLA